MNQIEAAISVLSRFSGAPQFEWVQELIPVLQDRLGLKGSSEEVISLEANIDLKGLMHLSGFYEAIINEQVLYVEYQDFKSDEPFNITFHPYYLKQYNTRWFVFGLNEEFNIPSWNLALDRVVTISQTQKKYKKCDIDWEDYFYDIIGVTKKANNNVQEVVLEFSEQSAPYVLTKPIHPSQKTEEKDGMLIVTIKVIPNYEMESVVMSFGENVRVIGPTMLKDRIRKRYLDATIMYQSLDE